MSKRIRAIQGGTSASKTISILLYLIASAQSDKQKTLTSIISPTPQTMSYERFFDDNEGA